MSRAWILALGLVVGCGSRPLLGSLEGADATTPSDSPRVDRPDDVVTPADVVAPTDLGGMDVRDIGADQGPSPDVTRDAPPDLPTADAGTDVADVRDVLGSDRADVVTADVARCADPLQPCDGVCTDVSTSAEHCGACGRRCGAGLVCQSGTCANACASGLVSCGLVCTNLTRDTDNCGACGRRCTGGFLCTASVCVCPIGQQPCDTRCVDTSSDAMHCGGCGRPCPSGQVCGGGRCVLGCPSGTTACGSQCVNLLLDRSHCGTCENACQGIQVCLLGRCTL